MVKRLLVILLLLASYTAQSQVRIEPHELFSQAIEKNIKKYRIESKQAYLDDDLERAEFLFDSLVQHVVKGTYLDNFKVRKRSGKKVELENFDKPVFMMTYASWCTPGVGEVPALNEIARNYSDVIDFVVLFWDERGVTRKTSRCYDRSHINVVYVDETENKYNHVIEKMKHSVGFPTCFFMDEHKKIIDVRRGVFHPYHESYTNSFNMNYNAFAKGISLLQPGLALPDTQVGVADKP